MILIVSYDLKSARDYTTFYESLKAQGSWWHYLASTWLISTDKSPAQVAEAVRPYIEPTDFLLVTEMGKTYQGYLPKPAWDWIEEHKKETATFIPFGEYNAPLASLADLALGGLGGKPPTSQVGTVGKILAGETPKTALLGDLLGGKQRSPWSREK
jgi:hypothetical protein